MSDHPPFPRSLTEREKDWLQLLLPRGQVGYDQLRRAIEPLEVLGEGRWGTDDLMLGPPSAMIDHDEGMQPVVAFGEIQFDVGPGNDPALTLSLHQPNEEGVMEFQIGNRSASSGAEISRWTYSTWRPGESAPGSGEQVREIRLDSSGDLILVVAPGRRVLWLHDRTEQTNTLIPVTTYYNELMILSGIRDPRIALDRSRLFAAPGEHTDEALRDAFERYNGIHRKVDPARLKGTGERDMQRIGIRERFRRLLGGGD